MSRASHGIGTPRAALVRALVPVALVGSSVLWGGCVGDTIVIPRAGAMTDAGSAEPVDAGAIVVSAADFFDQARALRRERMTRCFGGTQAEYMLIEEVLLEDERIAGELQSVESGTRGFSPEAAAGCIEATRRRGCEGFDAWMLVDVRTSSCSSVIVGRLSAGQACATTIDCAPGTECDELLGCPGTCSRVCVATRARTQGEDCRDCFDRCAAGSSCEDGLCVVAEEQRRPSIGDACRGYFSCYPRFACPLRTGQQYCAEWLRMGDRCVPSERLCPPFGFVGCHGAPGAETCRRNAVVGEPCDLLSKPCISSRCLGGDDGRVCEPYVRRGGECASSLDCISGRCVDRECAPEILPGYCAP